MPEIAVPFFTATPATPAPGPGIVVVMEGNGISPQLLRVCQRLAHEGYAVIAPDLYWRSGGSDPAKAMEQMTALAREDGLADIQDAVGRLRTLGASKIGVTGFCMGGGYAYLAAISGEVEVDAAVPFYGGGIAQSLGTPQCPMLAFFGGQDEWIPRDQIAQIEAHHPGDVVVYEDAEHGFMRDGSPNYHEAAATDAWQRMLEFFAQHLRGQ
jgi:carboxymethylenebutenolidase